MYESFNDIKNEISSKFLGKEGIHGIGVSRAQIALKIYLEPDGV